MRARSSRAAPTRSDGWFGRPRFPRTRTLVRRKKFGFRPGQSLPQLGQVGFGLFESLACALGDALGLFATAFGFA